MSEDMQDNTESQETSAETQKTEHMIPKSRFDEVNNKLKQLQKQFDETSKAQRDSETKALEEQNRYKELYEKLLAEYEPLKQASEKAARFQSALESTNQSRLERIPEDKRSLIPAYDDPVMLGDWLDRNLSLITEQARPTAPSADGGARSTSTASSPKLTDYELMLAKAAGMSPERYAEQKAKRGEAVTLESLRDK